MTRRVMIILVRKTFIFAIIILAIMVFAFVAVTSGASNKNVQHFLFKPGEELSEKEKLVFTQVQTSEMNLQENVVNDFANTHDIEFNDYQFLDQWADPGVVQRYQDLYIAMEKHAMKDHDIGDIKPFVFVDTNTKQAMVLLKKADGNNQLHIFKFTNGEWKYYTNKETPGQKITEKHLYEVLIQRNKK